MKPCKENVPHDLSRKLCIWVQLFPGQDVTDHLMQVNTSSLMDWYNEWKQQPKDTPIMEDKLPCVLVTDLLNSLGVPVERRGSIVAHLTDDDLPELRRLALPSFNSLADSHFVSQLVDFKYPPSAAPDMLSYRMDLAG